MLLKQLSLQNFRSYQKATYNFSKDTTVIVGRNTAGKTNLLEAMYMFGVGKSFRAEKEKELIRFGEKIARITSILKDVTEEKTLEILIVEKGEGAPTKKFSVNGVAKPRAHFCGNFPVVLFAPADLELITGGPSLRRSFLDDVLIQTDYEYRVVLIAYGKALRQRNALLSLTKETGVRREDQFAYWDEELITNGQSITKKRAAFIGSLNAAKKDIFDFLLAYDNSEISTERLLQYKDAEVGAGVTLVGPHRDEVLFYFKKAGENREVKHFGSRGQQRLVVLQLKLLSLNFLKERLGQDPTLLLDDIFSELDEGHIALVSEMIGHQQTVLTTTHKEFLANTVLKKALVIELGEK